MAKFKIRFVDKSGLAEIEGEILEEKLPSMEGDALPFENIKFFLKKLNTLPLEFFCPWENYVVELQGGQEKVVKISKDWVLKVKEEKEIVKAGIKGVEQIYHNIPQRILIGGKKL